MRELRRFPPLAGEFLLAVGSYRPTAYTQKQLFVEVGSQDYPEHHQLMHQSWFSFSNLIKPSEDSSIGVLITY